MSTHFGGPEVLNLIEVAEPQPPAGEVVVAVRAAGINPGEAYIREGYLEAMFPTTSHTRWRSGTGAPRGNQNATQHAHFTLKSRELRALGRIQNRTDDLVRAQWAVMELLAQGDAYRIEGAEERVAQRMQRLVKAALAADRVLAERGEEEGRRLVEGALQLTANV